MNQRPAFFVFKIFLASCFTIGSFYAEAQKITYDTVPYIMEHHRNRLALFAKEPIVKGKIIFLGNSITEGGDWKKLFNDSTIINRGIGGDIGHAVLKRLDDVIAREPSKLFLLIGINDISKNIPDSVIVRNIFEIVKRIKMSLPSTQVYVQSILPTNSTFKNTLPQHYNKDEHVVIINTQLRSNSQSRDYQYIDLFSKFQDTAGKLDARYTYDGLHLNYAGYQHWAEILKEMRVL
jgi:Lysophospholipase L1 and related esterases